MVTVTNTPSRVYAPLSVTKVYQGPSAALVPGAEVAGAWSCDYAGAQVDAGRWQLPAAGGTVDIALANGTLAGENGAILLPATSVCTVVEDTLPDAALVDSSYAWNAPTYDPGIRDGDPGGRPARTRSPSPTPPTGSTARSASPRPSISPAHRHLDCSSPAPGPAPTPGTPTPPAPGRSTGPEPTCSRGSWWDRSARSPRTNRPSRRPQTRPTRGPSRSSPPRASRSPPTSPPPRSPSPTRPCVS